MKKNVASTQIGTTNLMHGVVLDANHYTRTNDTNDDEIITISNKEIWSKFLKLFL